MHVQLVAARQREGMACPRCGNPKSYVYGRRVGCTRCGCRWSVTAGTVMALTEQGKVEISGTQAASYTVNKKDKTLTFEYSQAFGGQTVTMELQLGSSSLSWFNSTSVTNAAAREAITRNNIPKVVATQ